MLMRCCTKDGGRPAGDGVQALLPNHRLLLWSKATVVSEFGEVPVRRGQVRTKEMSNHEPSLKRREVVTDVKTSGSPLCWDKSKGYLITDLGGVRRADGMNLVQALVRNVGPYRCDVKGKARAVETVEGESTDAHGRFGAAHSSVEAPVIGVERRGCVIRCCSLVNCFAGGVDG